MIDLHIHTNATPHHATWTPDTLMAAAARAGLQVIAVTDHNTTAGVRAAQEAGRHTGIHVISGVEIDAGFPAGDTMIGCRPNSGMYSFMAPIQNILHSWRCVAPSMSATWQMQTGCSTT